MLNKPQKVNTNQAIGKVTKYVVGMDLESYSKQLYTYFLANRVTEAKKRKAEPLTNLSVKTHQLVKD